MNYIMIGSALIILLLVVSYFYFLILRFLHNIIKVKYYKKSISIALTLIIFIPLLYTRSILFITVIYIILGALIVDIIYFMFKRVTLNINKINYYRFSLIVPLIFSVIMTIYGYYNTKNIVRTEYNITTNKNINMDYKIGLISDLHFGESINKEKLLSIAQSINNENLDILILAGDIVDESTNIEDFSYIFEAIGKINTKFGIYYIHGNHDESQFNKNIEKNKKLEESITSNNINMLIDKSTQINNDFSLTGRLDYTYERSSSRKSANELIRKLDKNKLLLVADHQPYQYNFNKKAGFDIQLSGHTHAGQIWPFGLITSNMGFHYGLLKDDNFSLIVSSGLGVWGFPIRTEKHSEYVIININKNNE